MDSRLQLSLLALAVVLALPLSHGQTPAAPAPAPAPAAAKAADAALAIPQFDVISVKPSKQSDGSRVQFTPDGMRGTGVNVRFLLYEGYGGINHEQVLGEPGWTNTDAFDIEAKVAPADVPTLAKMTFEQRRTMFQSILADRFKLAVHHETRELPIYVLSVGKGGVKFRPSAPDDPAGAPRRKGMMINRGKLTADDAQISTLVTILSRQLGRTVVDKTGLTGSYDFTLEWTPDEGGPPPPPRPPDGSPAPATGAPDPGASIFTALQEQLGLKLESTKGPVDVVVIDHIERPTEN
jgi:uncharacterized protein (TIGR03435 family)